MSPYPPFHHSPLSPSAIPGMRPQAPAGAYNSELAAWLATNIPGYAPPTWQASPRGTNEFSTSAGQPGPYTSLLTGSSGLAQTPATGPVPPGSPAAPAAVTPTSPTPASPQGTPPVSSTPVRPPARFFDEHGEVDFPASRKSKQIAYKPRPAGARPIDPRGSLRQKIQQADGAPVTQGTPIRPGGPATSPTPASPAKKPVATPPPATGGTPVTPVPPTDTDAADAPAEPPTTPQTSAARSGGTAPPSSSPSPGPRTWMNEPPPLHTKLQNTPFVEAARNRDQIRAQHEMRRDEAIRTGRSVPASNKAYQRLRASRGEQ